MKTDRFVTAAAAAVMLQDVLARLSANESLSTTRRRDLRSAITTYAKLIDQKPDAIALDLAAIRQTLDRMVPAAAKVSAKRWANLRSDLASAFEASGLQPMLKTARVELAESWSKLLEPITEQNARTGVSRLARWASLRQIPPQAVDDAVLERFISELEDSTLIRNIGEQHRTVAKTWNFTVRLRPDLGLQAIAVPASKNAPTRECWQSLPESFCTDVDNYLAWCAMPDPLDDAARVRALASTTRRLRRDHIHSAVTTAIAAGIDRSQLRSLANLVEVETYRTILRQRYADDGRTLSAYTHGIAGTLIAIAAEWAGVSAEGLAVLKKLRSKLGSLPSGLTEKNEALLRKFNDPRLVRQMLELPDRLWRQARRELVQSKGWAFVTLQTALALDILMHVPLRMQNLALLNFSKHLRWPQGVGKPAMVVFNEAETKNKVILEFELVAPLAERFRTYRDEIAPSVIGRRTDAVFVHASGKPRTQAALAVAIEKAILRHVGVRFTPHQFRHFAAKLILDENPGAIEQVRQMLGHENLKTTMNFYAGIDTRRAGRAHANLLIDLRAGALRRDPRKRRST